MSFSTHDITERLLKVVLNTPNPISNDHKIVPFVITISNDYKIVPLGITLLYLTLATHWFFFFFYQLMDVVCQYKLFIVGDIYNCYITVI
jgi:hypothetical protein